MSDNVSTLHRAIDQIDRLVAAVPADATGDATPCDEYDVTTLIEHLIVIADRITTAAGGEAGGEIASPAGDEAPAIRSRAAHAAVTTAIQQADPTTLAHLPFGTMPLDAAFSVFIGEFATHGWDLAVAIGRAYLLDDTIAEMAVDLVTARIPAAHRDQTPFGDLVHVPPGAPAYDRLAGWMGRDPARWHTARRGEQVPGRPSPGTGQSRRWRRQSRWRMEKGRSSVLALGASATCHDSPHLDISGYYGAMSTKRE